MRNFHLSQPTCLVFRLSPETFLITLNNLIHYLGKIACVTCINPELKLEQLAKIQNDSSLSVNNNMSDEDSADKQYKLITIINGERFEYIEWQLVRTPNLQTTDTKKNKRGSKVSSKVSCVHNKAKFHKKLILEMETKQEHLTR